ncbi:MAG: hypothetical protein MUE69_08790 [Myxococcota bacterium]|nr:hypothetical protein [Myxococcota bacterium]
MTLALVAPPRGLLEAHEVFVKGEKPFQARARLLQALWREAHGLPIGGHGDHERLGSHLALPEAKTSLANFLTPTIAEVAKTSLRTKQRGAVMQPTRLFGNLLSSQPLCFNLFGELAADLDLAARVLRRLGRSDVAKVIAIRFEWSPGRGDARYTSDKSAFDVFVEYERAHVPTESRDSESEGRAFLGFEVKYHETLGGKPGKHRARYDEVADAMNVFVPARDALRKNPLQQIWCDHLLAGSMLLADPEWTSGTSVLLYPKDNPQCADAIARYRRHLVSAETFDAWTLESFANALRAETDATWVQAFDERYLDFTPVDDAIAAWRSR